MEEDIQDLTISILKKNREKKFSVRSLHIAFCEEFPTHKISYGSFQRVIDVLIAKKKIKGEDFNKVLRVVSYD